MCGPRLVKWFFLQVQLNKSNTSGWCMIGMFWYSVHGVGGCGRAAYFPAFWTVANNMPYSVHIMVAHGWQPPNRQEKMLTFNISWTLRNVANQRFKNMFIVNILNKCFISLLQKSTMTFEWRCELTLRFRQQNVFVRVRKNIMDLIINTKVTTAALNKQLICDKQWNGLT